VESWIISAKQKSGV